MMRWKEQGACLGQKKNAYKVLVGNMRDRGHFKDLGINVKIIFKIRLENVMGEHELG
jgi:hypothetical protein